MDALEAELARFETELAQFEQPGACGPQQQSHGEPIVASVRSGRQDGPPPPRMPPPHLPPPNMGGSGPPSNQGLPRVLPPPPIMGPPPIQQGRPPPPRPGPPPPMAPPMMRPPVRNQPPGLLGAPPPSPSTAISQGGAGPSYQYGADFYGYQQESIPGYSAGPVYPPTQQQGPASSPQGQPAEQDPSAGGKKSKEGDGRKKKPLARKAAGEKWFDPTLSEWDENDFRIFVGDLGNEVNDDILTKAFSKYPTFIKAKVIRDKRTNKTRGYGFVSVADGNDFAKIMKEMQGKYIGNRPCKLRKSTWKDRSDPDPKRKYKEKAPKGNSNKRQRGVLHK